MTMPGTLQGLEGEDILFSIEAFILGVKRHRQLERKKKQSKIILREVKRIRRGRENGVAVPLL